MDMSIAFPNLGITLEHVGKSINLFGIEIAYYGIIIACGMALALFIIQKEAARTGQSEDDYFYGTILCIVIGILGARAYYVLFSWDYYSQHPDEILMIRNGGLAIYGGIIAGVLTALLLCRIKKYKISLALDTIVVAVPLAQAIGRWGNFCNREAFGDYTDNLLAMRLPVNAVRQHEITQTMWDHLQTINGVEYIQVHPTFLYESMWNLCLFLLLFFLIRHKKWDGQIFATYLGGYGLGRIWIEGLRTDQLLLPFLHLPVSQVLSGILVVAAALAYLAHRRKKTG